MSYPQSWPTNRYCTIIANYSLIGKSRLRLISLSHSAARVPELNRPLLASLAAFLICCTGIIGLSGCERQTKRPKVGRLPPAGSLVIVIGPSEKDPDWPAIRGGAMRYAKSAPHLKFEFLAPAIDDATARRALINDCIARQPKAICLYVTDQQTDSSPEREDPFRELAADLRRSGILLVTMGRLIGDGPVGYAHIGVDRTAAAAAIGSNLKTIAGDRHSYLLLHERGKSPEATRIHASFTTSARFAMGVSLLRDSRAALRAPEQRAQLRAMLSEFPNAGLIVALTPLSWLDAATDARLLPRCQFVTLSSSPRLWPRLREREAAALAGPLHGDIGFAAAAKAWTGLISGAPAGEVKLIATELITPETIDEFARRYAESAGLPLEQLIPKE